MSTEKNVGDVTDLMAIIALWNSPFNDHPEVKCNGEDHIICLDLVKNQFAIGKCNCNENLSHKST